TVATGLLTSGFSPAPARGSSGGRFDITGRGPPSRRRRSSTNHAPAAALANEMTAVAITDRDGSPPAAFIHASAEHVTAMVGLVVSGPELDPFGVAEIGGLRGPVPTAFTAATA